MNKMARRPVEGLEAYKGPVNFTDQPDGHPNVLARR